MNFIPYDPSGSEMDTRLLPCDAHGLECAAALLATGAPVAVPTETVYGLAANALDAAAVSRIYAAKGRPATNPLIVHVPRRLAGPDELAAAGLIAELRAGTPQRVVAERLMRAFWPGPLTIVLPKGARVAPAVTAGHATVALRMPAHSAFLSLLDALPFPLAAPSANRSNSISPTRAEHVLQELSGRIPLVLDGGPASVGVESTIVAVEEDGSVRLLRPGGLPSEAVEALIGSPLHTALPGPTIAPGMGSLHYAPRRPVILVSRSEAPPVSFFRASGSIGILLLTGEAVCPTPWQVACGAAHLTIVTLGDAGDGRSAARGLFAALRALDEAGVETILAERPHGLLGAWPAVHDRLRRAAGPRTGVDVNVNR